MKRIQSAAIIDEHSKIIEIKDGINITFEDGYEYLTTDDNTTAYRASASNGLIDGEFTIHETIADLEAVINNFSGPKP